ncbi:MAG: acyl-CoA thioesterase domain-containing protein [Pseudomonadota bacterium]
MISAELLVLGEDCFLGPAQTDTVHQVFGGHFIAQALLAAHKTTEADQLVHSLHSYFLMPGDSSADIQYEVEHIRDGRSSSTRQVIARQNDHDVFRLIASFSCDRGATVHSFDAMPSVPHYEELSAYTFEGDWAWADGLECRYVNLPGEQSGDETKINVWIRIHEEIANQLQNPNVALAYLSDATVGDGVFHRKGWNFEDPTLRYLSLDHTIWFHQMAPAGQWMLFEQSADWVGAGRGLARTRAFSENGDLIASCAQEALAYVRG